jgi:uncharacterized protein (TIGR02246 family)
MSEETLLVDAQVAAYRARDLESFLSFYAEDVVIKDFDGNVVMDGLDALRQQYGQLFANSSDLRVELGGRMSVGEYVIDEEKIDGFILPGYPTQLHAVVVYRVGDGKIRSVVFLS